jgi:hypothetical protein
MAKKIFNKNHKMRGGPFCFVFLPFFGFLFLFWALLVRRAHKRRKKITCARALSSTSDGDDGLAMQQPLCDHSLGALNGAAVQMARFGDPFVAYYRSGIKRRLEV